jgi:hypothetical protein
MLCHHPCSQLAAGSEFAENWEQNNAYLLALEPDNLLFNFRCWGVPCMICVRNSCWASGLCHGGWPNSLHSAPSCPGPPHPHTSCHLPHFLGPPTAQEDRWAARPWRVVWRVGVVGFGGPRPIYRSLPVGHCLCRPEHRCGAGPGGWAYLQAAASSATRSPALAGYRFLTQLSRHTPTPCAPGPGPAGRSEFRDRCSLMVGELKKVQDAFGNGYLGGRPCHANTCLCSACFAQFCGGPVDGLLSGVCCCPPATLCVPAHARAYPPPSTALTLLPPLPLPSSLQCPCHPPLPLPSSLHCPCRILAACSCLPGEPL